MFASILPRREGATIVLARSYTRRARGRRPIVRAVRRAAIGAFDIVRAVADPLAQTVEFDGPGGAGRATSTGPAAPGDAPGDAQGDAPGNARGDALASGAADSGRRVIGGRYEVLGLLGAGGMGNVYRARDRELDEPVALKVLRPEIAANAAALSRFRREVKLARRVTHPNVARVFDIGDEGGERYLTMELVDGEPLAATLARSGRLGPARAIEVAKAVCAGLGAAHAAGVVHRDLKPDNVLLAKDGRVVVTDFGIARAAAEGDAKLTGTIVGTPAYMAPEQVEGKVADERADIYALGAMLFELLTGDVPWRGDNVFAVAAARLLEPPPDPRTRRPDLPAALAAIVLRAMARAPEDRFATAGDVARALAAVELAPATPSIAAPSIAAPSIARRAEPLVLSESPAPGKKQVAVLPFRNAGAAEHDHIADGLTEDLIDLLSMAKDLRVRSRGMVMRYREGERDPREIGRELGVPVVVTGSVRKAGGSVRISVRLVSVADGVQIWHRRFDRPEAELFAVSEAAARAIAEALTVEIAAPAYGAPEDGEAIDLYLRARSKYLRYFSDLTGESIQLFERALALAPDDPRILAGYAMASGRLVTGGAPLAEKARLAAERAILRAPNLADAHVAFAMVEHQQGRHAEAIGSLARALRLSRFSAEAHDVMGRILSETTLQEPARRHLEIALALEPELHLARTLLARAHMLGGRWEMADAVLDAAPAGGGPNLPATARMCLWTRDIERARRVRDDPAMQAQAMWSMPRVLLDFIVDGVSPFDHSPVGRTMTPRFQAFLRQIEAECSMFADDRGRALGALESAVALGAIDVAWADHCPLFAPLRGEPRFEAVRAELAARAKQIEDAYLAAA